MGDFHWIDGQLFCDQITVIAKYFIAVASTAFVFTPVNSSTGLSFNVTARKVKHIICANQLYTRIAAGSRSFGTSRHRHNMRHTKASL